MLRLFIFNYCRAGFASCCLSLWHSTAFSLFSKTKCSFKQKDIIDVFLVIITFFKVRLNVFVTGHSIHDSIFWLFSCRIDVSVYASVLLSGSWIHSVAKALKYRNIFSAVTLINLKGFEILTRSAASSSVFIYLFICTFI